MPTPALVNAKNIVVYLDGTGDSPEINKESANHNRSPTNIQRMHEATVEDESQVPIYFPGIATGDEDTVFDRTEKAIEFYFGHGAKKKREEAKDKVLEAYEDGDQIFLFGFSRGAAIIRDLANHLVIDEKIGSISFVGLFDCVASFGIPIDIWKIPTQRINLGKELALPDEVNRAYHLVAIHEPRQGFEPTLISRSDKFKEIWFAGSHKDIGGGYVERGMADLTMRYMMEKAEADGVIFKPGSMPGINPVTPGEEMHMFREGVDQEPRDFSGSLDSKNAIFPVTLHASVANWESMHSRSIPLDSDQYVVVPS